MTDPAPLPPGPVPLTREGLEIVRATGRVGDGLVYEGRDRGMPARLREFAPSGIARRSPNGALEPSDDSYAPALANAIAQVVEQGPRLAGFIHPGVLQVLRTEVAEGGATVWQIGAPAGEPLRHALEAGVVYTPADVVRFAGELADVLADLHGRGLTHLDIAPETISVASGRVQLSDFAIDNRPFIALLHGPGGLVRPGFAGIEHYDAAMEEPLSPPADVHAASALLYRLVTGREPPPWQERWRNPDVAALPEHGDYPPGFLQAIAKGMAIEPGDRFASGAEWRAALNLPRRIGPTEPARVAVENPSRGLAPVLVGIALLVIALLGFLAWHGRWLVADGGNQQQPRPEPPAQPIRVGDTAQGQLGPGDVAGPGGGYRDSFSLAGRRGDRLALRVSAQGFTPALSLFGPGLAGQQGENGRLTITLPQDGAYTIVVGSGRAGAGGDYSLEVVPAPELNPDPGPVDPAAARRLSGTWRQQNDQACELPAVNSVQGTGMTVVLRGETFHHRIDAAGGDSVDTTVEGGRLDGGTFHFRVAPDGDSYDMDGETWTRC